MKFHQLVLPVSEPYQKRVAALFARLKALNHPDVKRSMGAVTEAACLFVKPVHGSKLIELFEQYRLNQPPRNRPRPKHYKGAYKIDIRCWREARLTATKIAIANDFDLGTRELVCLALLSLDELTDQQLTQLLLALPAQKTALLEKQI